MGEQQCFAGAVHDANSPALKIVKPLIPPDAQERIERAVKYAHASLRKQIRVVHRTNGIVQQAYWLASPAETNKKLRRTGSPAQMKEIFL